MNVQHDVAYIDSCSYSYKQTSAESSGSSWLVSLCDGGSVNDLDEIPSVWRGVLSYID